VCHLRLNQRDYSSLSHLFLPLFLQLSVFIDRSPVRFLTSFFHLPVVESLPNEVADGSILQRDRVWRSPTLKSINLTVSISEQTSLSWESKKERISSRVTLLCLSLILLNIFGSHFLFISEVLFALLTTSYTQTLCFHQSTACFLGCRR